MTKEAGVEEGPRGPGRGGRRGAGESPQTPGGEDQFVQVTADCCCPLPQHRPPRESTATGRRGGAAAHPQRSWHPGYNGSYCQLQHFFQTFWRLLRARGESPGSRSGRGDPATAPGGDPHPHCEASGLRQVHAAAEPLRAPQRSRPKDSLGAETPALDEEALETRSWAGLHLTSGSEPREPVVLSFCLEGKL